MLSSLFQSSTIPVLEQVVNFTEARHGVLAGNIANLDTPGYRTRDLSPALFQERLKEAIETRHQPPTPAYDSDPFGLTPTYDAQPRRDRELASLRRGPWARPSGGTASGGGCGRLSGGTSRSWAADGTWS